MFLSVDVAGFAESERERAEKKKQSKFVGAIGGFGGFRTFWSVDAIQLALKQRAKRGGQQRGARLNQRQERCLERGLGRGRFV